MAIGHRGTGSATFSAASFAPAIPTAQVEQDMLLLLVGGKPYNSTRTVSTTDWNSLGSFTDGTTAAGNGTGSMFVEAWWKYGVSAQDTDPTITEGATAWDVVGGIIMVFSKANNEVWSTPVIAGGGDASAGTGFSVTTGSLAIAAGDHCVSFAAFRDDAATPTSTVLAPTLAGCTFSNTRDPATDPESTTGGDMGMTVTRSTLTGSGSGAVTLACTLPASHTGSAAIIRLRVTTPTAAPYIESTRHRAAHRFLTLR